MKSGIYALGRAGKSLKYSFEKHAILSPPDILFLTVPDNALSQVALQLSNEPKLPPIIAHLSGAHSYRILEPLQDKAAIAQFHPLAALTGQEAIPPETLCAISSNQPWAEQILVDLAQNIDLIPVKIDPNKTTQYHTAAVLTGNLTLGLVLKSMELMQEAGIHPDKARLGLSRLLQSVAHNLAQQNIPEALTGPMARKDTQTIQKHLDILEPDIKQVYQTLSNLLVKT